MLSYWSLYSIKMIKYAYKSRWTQSLQTEKKDTNTGDNALTIKKTLGSVKYKMYILYRKMATFYTWKHTTTTASCKKKTWMLIKRSVNNCVISLGPILISWWYPEQGLNGHQSFKQNYLFIVIPQFFTHVKFPLADR